jgi:hypothetical protein
MVRAIIDAIKARESGNAITIIAVANAIAIKVQLKVC